MTTNINNPGSNAASHSATAALNTSIASNFMLASFSKGMISNSKLDKSVSNNVEAQHHVSKSGLVRVYKTLFSGAIGDAYTAATQLQNACYTHYMSQSAPFTASDRHNRGDRIVPVATAMTLQSSMAALIGDFQIAVQNLSRAIDDPANRASAVTALGSMGDASLLPTGQDVIEKCYVEFDLSAMPDPSTLSGMQLPAEFTARLVANTEAQQGKALDKALGDITERVMAEINRITKTTGDLIDAHAGRWQGQRAPKVYDTLRSNIAGLAQLLRGTAIGVERDDLVEVANAIESRLTNYDVKALRNSANLAEELHHAAKEIGQTLSPTPSSAINTEFDELITDVSEVSSPRTTAGVTDRVNDDAPMMTPEEVDASITEALADDFTTPAVQAGQDTKVSSPRTTAGVTDHANQEARQEKELDEILGDLDLDDYTF